MHLRKTTILAAFAALSIFSFHARAQSPDPFGGKLFPPLVRLLSQLGVSVRYGIPKDDRPLLGDAAPLISHALVS